MKHRSRFNTFVYVWMCVSLWYVDTFLKLSSLKEKDQNNQDNF